MDVKKKHRMTARDFSSVSAYYQWRSEQRSSSSDVSSTGSLKVSPKQYLKKQKERKRVAVETARQKKADERAARMTVREAQKAEQQEMKALFQELPIEMPASTVKLDMSSNSSCTSGTEDDLKEEGSITESSESNNSSAVYLTKHSEASATPPIDGPTIASDKVSMFEIIRSNTPEGPGPATLWGILASLSNAYEEQHISRPVTPAAASSSLSKNPGPATLWGILASETEQVPFDSIDSASPAISGGILDNESSQLENDGVMELAQPTVDVPTLSGNGSGLVTHLSMLVDEPSQHYENVTNLAEFTTNIPTLTSNGAGPATLWGILASEMQQDASGTNTRVPEAQNASGEMKVCPAQGDAHSESLIVLSGSLEITAGVSNNIAGSSEGESKPEEVEKGESQEETHPQGSADSLEYSEVVEVVWNGEQSESADSEYFSAQEAVPPTGLDIESITYKDAPKAAKCPEACKIPNEESINMQLTVIAKRNFSGDTTDSTTTATSATPNPTPTDSRPDSAATQASSASEDAPSPRQQSSTSKAPDSISPEMQSVLRSIYAHFNDRCDNLEEQNKLLANELYTVQQENAELKKQIQMGAAAVRETSEHTKDALKRSEVLLAEFLSNKDKVEDLEGEMDGIVGRVDSIERRLRVFRRNNRLGGGDEEEGRVDAESLASDED